MNGSNWQIQHQCPQCGGPITVEETDRILVCGFCRTRLFIVAAGPFHYYIPAPSEDDLVYIPYWRLRGLAYTVKPLETANKYLDTNRLAVTMKGLTPSLGVRPQAMKLRFLTPETPGAFLRPTLKAEEVLQQRSPISGALSHDVFIGEAVSLIYTPMIVKNGFLHDAFQKRPVMPWTEDDQGKYPVLNQAERNRTQFLPTLCPHCGWDLQGAKDTLLMNCRNCQTVWSYKGTALKAVSFIVMAGAGAGSRYLPFWRLKLRFEGISLVSFADLVRMANLPKAITPAMEKTPVYFWSPAFKVNPALYLRWARQATIYQPEEAGMETLPAQPLYPAGLSSQEALESVIITLGSIVTDKRTYFSRLPQLKMHLEEAVLVYHPFAEERRELIHERMKVVIDRNALSFGAFM